MQLIGAATSDVPNQTPMPQPSSTTHGHHCNIVGGLIKKSSFPAMQVKDCPGFLNSTGRLGPKRGRKCYVTPAFSGVPNKGDKITSQNLR